MPKKLQHKRKPSHLRDHPSYLINDPSSRLYMSPDTVIPPYWNVDSSYVYWKFELNFDGGFHLESKTVDPIAHQNRENIYLLDDGSRYLFYYATCDELAEIVRPTELGDIMEAFDHQRVKLRWIDDPLQT